MGPGYHSSGKVVFDFAYMNEINSRINSDIFKLMDNVDHVDASVSQWGLGKLYKLSGKWRLIQFQEV